MVLNTQFAPNNFRLWCKAAQNINDNPPIFGKELEASCKETLV